MNLFKPIIEFAKRVELKCSHTHRPKDMWGDGYVDYFSFCWEIIDIHHFVSVR